MGLILLIDWAWAALLLAVGAGAGVFVFVLSGRLRDSNQELDQVKSQVLEWNRRLEGKISQHSLEAAETHQRLEETYLQVVSSLIEAMGAKDTYLSSHAYNVAHYARIIAEQMGMSKAKVHRLVHGCELHDLGKIAIPDNVLLKQGPLSRQEYEIIKQHPYWGARILKPITSMKDVVAMVHQEHERWDGSGYPQGLRGEKICLGARIIAVADALDAMLSDRPYRARITVEKACEEVQACAGTQFDPVVAEACLQAFKEGRLTVPKHAHPHHYEPEEVKK